MIDYQKALRDTFHLSFLMPHQELVVTRILECVEKKERTESITILPTGAGKSLIFMLPSFIIDTRYEILVYPLLALMHDQLRRFEESGINATLLSGGMTREEKQKALMDLKTMRSHIIITNPEMLTVMVPKHQLDFLIGKIELMVLDEAHTLIAWGETFRDRMLELPDIIDYLKPHQTCLFTATMSAEIERKTRRLFFKEREPILLRVSADRTNIYYKVIHTINRERDLDRLLERKDLRPTLVFCNYRAETEDMYRRYKDLHECYYYHAGLEREEKTNIENTFLHSDNGILFSTNAYGMGVNKNGIRCVIHLHTPSDALSYLQETGRAGRDGKPSTAILLSSPLEHMGLEDVFTCKTCIRNALLKKLGEEIRETGCTLCDACMHTEEKSVGEKTIMGFITYLPFVFTKEKLFKALRILHLKETRHWSRSEFNNALKALFAMGKIGMRNGHLYRRRKPEG